MMGVDVDDGPTSEQIIAACGRCEDWSREDRMRLEYVLMDSLKGKDLTKTYTVDGFIQVIQGNNTAKLIIPNKPVGPGYDPFAPVDKKMSMVLTDWLKLDLLIRRLTSKSFVMSSLEDLSDDLPHMDALINLLRKQYQNNPQHFRSERICFMGHVFSRQWTDNYLDFKSSEGDHNFLGRRLPGGVWNYHAGLVPTFCQSIKVMGLDVDDIYAPMNFKNNHWIAIWISIPKKHIVVWDNILTHISPEELDEVMEPFVTMIPYLLVECIGSDEQRVQHTLEPYTYERLTVWVPQCIPGDCGVYTLKYIECHALGMSFPPYFCKKNAKAMREKVALDVFQETLGCHQKENEDNIENLATYEQRG
ncbi:hypothetical protein F2Q70_00021871 [Brassica cretica]|uniref:Ubiquitin-like protease family profile domain-containing protein n=1 Tax=Brassica cretica TaxID=69181 RepID=A0A8S9GSM8_BRACR|nr:hypothetical protein F2Q70_00021871 [Brassica cretica]